MGRGKERLLTCDACGRQVPRDKAVEYIKSASVGSEFAELVITSPKKVYYCVSCGKHRKIYEKKKEAAAKKRGRWL